MEGNGSEAEGLPRRKSILFKVSFISLVLGLVAFATGFLMYSYGWHHMYWFGLGDSRLTAMRMWEWGQWAEGAGIILVILGVTLLALGIMRWDRKQVQA